MLYYHISILFARDLPGYVLRLRVIRAFQLADGDFIGHSLLAFRLADLFRVFPALDASPDEDPCSDAEAGGVSGIAAPGDAWDIV